MPQLARKDNPFLGPASRRAVVCLHETLKDIRFRVYWADVKELNSSYYWKPYQLLLISVMVT